MRASAVYAVLLFLAWSDCSPLAHVAAISNNHNNTQHVFGLHVNPSTATTATTASLADAQATSLSDKWKTLKSQAESSSEAVMECVTCQTLLGLFKVLANGIGAKSTEETLLAVCPAFDKHMPTEVCQGLIRQQAIPVAEMFSSTNFEPLGEQGRLFCYSVLGMCPMPDVQPYKVTFPKPRPAKVKRPMRSGKTFKALHLSDWHVQLDYTAGSEAACNSFVCCIGHNSTTSAIDRQAAAFGDYNCDSPPALATSLLSSIQNVSGTPKLSIFTGDVDDHAMWRDNEQYSVNASVIAYAELHRHLDALGSKLYPTFGNHESGPSNQYKSTAQHSLESQQWLYDLEAQLWTGWLDEGALEMLRNNGHGSYSVQPSETPNLRIISLNTNLGYVDNWYTYWRTAESDPSGIFAFLVDELQAAEDAGQAAWIIMHVPPTQSDALVDFGNYYLQVIQRYNETITAQFAGHTHRDEFSIEYAGQGSTRNGQTAAGVIYIGPSVTPFTSLNPGWRTYDVDSGSYEIMDTHTYIANLSLSSSWSEVQSPPTWFEEYSARETYVPDWPASEPLSPAFWDAAADSILHDQHAWERYFLLRGKSSGRDGQCAFGDDCQRVIAQDLKAGQAAEYTTPVGGTRKRSVVRREAKREHRRKGLQSCERSLCGERPSLASLLDEVM